MKPRAKCSKTGKTKYGSHEQAQHDITFIWSRDPNVHIGDLHTYECPYCKRIHIGHVKYAPENLLPV